MVDPRILDDAGVQAVYQARMATMASGHLDDPAWEQLACGELSDAERLRAMDHITRCRDCASIYSALQEVGEQARRFDPNVPATSAHTPWTDWRPYFAAAAAIALLALGVVIGRATRLTSPTPIAPTVIARGNAAVDSVVRERDGAVARVQEQERRMAALEQGMAVNEAAELNVPIADLGPDTLRGSAAPVPEIVIPASARTITLVLSSDAERAFPDYALELTASGKTVWSATGIRRTAANTFTLSLPVRLFAPGLHHLRLYGVSNGRREALDEYTMRIQKP